MVSKVITNSKGEPKKFSGQHATALFQIYVSEPEEFYYSGNNIFALDIPPVLEKMKNSEERTAWIAMDRLCPVPFQNYMIRTGSEDIKLRAVNSELGIFGAIIGYGTFQQKIKMKIDFDFFFF